MIRPISLSDFPLFLFRQTSACSESVRPGRLLLIIFVISFTWIIKAKMLRRPIEFTAILLSSTEAWRKKPRTGTQF
jgi:hypothetical protein